MPHLSNYSLRQRDDDYVRSLDGEALCSLTLRLLADLKAAREQSEQNPTNSSRPPSSRAPWERIPPKASTEVETEEDLPPDPEPTDEPSSPTSREPAATGAEAPAVAEAAKTSPPRRSLPRSAERGSSPVRRVSDEPKC